MDLEARKRWEDYIKAKEIMLKKRTYSKPNGVSCPQMTTKSTPEL